MPLDCTNSNVISDALCDQIVVCLRDTSGGPYFGTHGTGPFANGSSPNGYAQDYPAGTPYEGSPATFQCFVLDYVAPTNGATTDTIEIQETDASNNPVGNPCILSFNIPTPCNTTGPSCPTPTPVINYDLNNPTGNIVRDIVGNFGFAANCTIISVSASNATLNPSVTGAAGTSITINQGNIAAAGVGTYTISYSVDCGVDGNVDCTFTINVTDSAVPLACPTTTQQFNYDLSTQTTDMTVSIADMGYDANCTLSAVSATGLTTSLTNSNTVINIDATSIANAGAGTYPVNYTVTCDGESVNCSFNLVVNENADVCPNCAAVQANWDGAPIAIGSTQNINCGAAGVNFDLMIPNPQDVNLDYFLPANSSGSFTFVTSGPVTNGMQTQTWQFTPKTSGCAETVDVVLTWLTTGNQAGCTNCPLFTISVGNCADCGNGSCTTTAGECTINTTQIQPGQEFTLTLDSGCDCPGCTVSWFNAATNPSSITLSNSTGRTVTNVFPSGVPVGNYSFIPACCNCDE